MTPAQKLPFPYPLQLGALEEFCHPHPGHMLAAPHVSGTGRESVVFVGNTYIALRVSNGLWMDSDFAPPPAGFLDRLEKLPWGRHGQLKDTEWRALQDVRPFLFRRAPISPWLHHRVAPSPVWSLAEQHLVRLCHLQLISRLPRCEVWCGEASRMEPLFFRFSSGAGILAWDKTLHDPQTAPAPAFSIFNPRRCPISGHRLSA